VSLAPVPRRAAPALSILDAMRDPGLFGPWFAWDEIETKISLSGEVLEKDTLFSW
jgi:hypothetical protein